MFSLEVIFVNPTNNVFVHEICLSTEQEKLDCTNKFFALAGNKLIDQKSDFSAKTEETSNGVWKLTSTIGKFATIKDAVDWFNMLIDFSHPYRKLERQYNIDNNVLSEANVLDMEGNLVHKIHSCNTDKCVRFGNCVTIQQGGCFSDISTINETMPKVFHIMREVVGN